MHDTPTSEPRALLEDYLSYLGVKKGRARCAKHIAEVRRRVGRMLKGVDRLEDLTPDRIEARLHELRAEPVRMVSGEILRRSTQTVDAHRRELGTFLRWIVRKKHLLASNPVEAVDPFEHEDSRGHSRPFTPEEAATFFARIPRERLVVYLWWSTTALRPAETRRVTWAHVVTRPADGSPPFVQVLRSTAKNKRAVRQPIHPDLVALLEPLRGAPSEHVFATLPTAATFKRDIRAAGLEPVRVTTEGKLTRTSLRKLFATSLDRSGASAGQVRELMRHGDTATTARYLRPDLAARAACVERLAFLPSWRRAEPATNALIAPWTPPPGMSPLALRSLGFFRQPLSPPGDSVA